MSFLENTTVTMTTTTKTVDGVPTIGSRTTELRGYIPIGGRLPPLNRVFPLASRYLPSSEPGWALDRRRLEVDPHGDPTPRKRKLVLITRFETLATNGK